MYSHFITLFALLFLACSGSDGKKTADPAPTSTGEEFADYEKATIATYLTGNGYKQWTGKKALYTSGTHGSVQSYFNKALVDSLAAENTTHPVGAAVVKEILKGDTVLGHAVMVKSQSSSEATSWTYYEVLTSGTDIYGEGHSSCISCHQANQIADYVASKPD
jgi:hypothetical protein